jgi:hypothetical protein
VAGDLVFFGEGNEIPCPNAANGHILFIGPGNALSVEVTN